MSAFTSATPQLSERQEHDRKFARRRSKRQIKQARPGMTFVWSPHQDLPTATLERNEGADQKFKPAVAFERKV